MRNLKKADELTNHFAFNRIRLSGFTIETTLFSFHEYAAKRSLVQQPYWHLFSHSYWNQTVDIVIIFVLIIIVIISRDFGWSVHDLISTLNALVRGVIYQRSIDLQFGNSIQKVIIWFICCWCNTPVWIWISKRNTVVDPQEHEDMKYAKYGRNVDLTIIFIDTNKKKTLII